MSAQVSPYAPLLPPPPGSEPPWWPINAAQQAARNSPAQLLLYGGASGGGKTNFLAADAMEEYQHPRLRALLIRTTLEEQQELEDIQQRMYEPKGAQWVKKRWRFPSGATIRPGYLAHDKHLNRYQGNPYSWLGIDESGQHPEHRIRFMIGWLAAPAESGLRVRGRFTCNPGGIGMGWEMKVFLRNRCPVHAPADFKDDRPWETSVYPGRVYRGSCWTDDSPVHKTTAFIPARLADNPLYGREKLESLLSQSKAVQQQLLYGCWCNAAGLYFDFMRPDQVVPYATIGDSWWWQHFISIDYGYGNSAAAAGLYAINPNGVVFKTRERIERKMSALKFAKAICKDGFDRAEFPAQGRQENWLKKLKARDPEVPRTGFCVMDEAMDQHRGTGKSIYDVMSEVFGEYQIGSIKAAHDPAGNAQVLYNGLANRLLILTRDSADLSLTYRAISSRIVDERKAVKKVHGAWEDDCYDECVAEGTLIAAERGNVPIEQIRIGEKVWTRMGLQRVKWCGVTGTARPTLTLDTSGGKHLIATGNHPIFIDGKGFVPLDSISYGDNIRAWEESRSSFSTGSSSDAIQMRKGVPLETTIPPAPATNGVALTCSIERSTSFSKGRSQRDTISTISTRIQGTTIPSILKLSTQTLMPQNIRETDGRTRSVARSTCDGFSPSPLLGTQRRKGKTGTVATLWKCLPIESRNHFSAKNATDHSRLSIAAETVSVPLNVPSVPAGAVESITSSESVRSVGHCSGDRDSTMPNTALESVLRLRIGGRKNVYNLTVDGQPEFFANGILVHNCSYAYNTWRQNSEKPARTALQEELADLRKQGMDETSLARIAWQREQAIRAKESKSAGGIRLSRATGIPGKKNS